MMISVAKSPFLLHLLVESAAALSFIFNPASQISPVTPTAALVLQSKGGLLLFTNLICVIFLKRPVDETTQSVALAFAFWHLWPCHRAVVRLRSGMDRGNPQVFGGPAVHLGAHLVLLFGFVVTGCLSS